MNTFTRAVHKFGLDAQLRQTQEECAELITAISHYMRKREGSKERLFEEMADVQIMISQLTLYMGYDEFSEKMTEKILKLQKLVE